jgi:hypothetical protein
LVSYKKTYNLRVTCLLLAYTYTRSIAVKRFKKSTNGYRLIKYYRWVLSMVAIF